MFVFGKMIQKNVKIKMAIDIKKIKPKTFKEHLKYYVQHFLFISRDKKYYKDRLTKEYSRLDYLIKRDTYWLNALTSADGKTQCLAYHEKAIKYYEYKNMIIQRRSQYVIIFLTLTLLLMTGFEIYLNFFG